MALAFRRALTANRCPPWAACAMGVIPRASAEAAFAPSSRRHLTIESFPAAQARPTFVGGGAGIALQHINTARGGQAKPKTIPQQTDQQTFPRKDFSLSQADRRLLTICAQNNRRKRNESCRLVSGREREIRDHHARRVGIHCPPSLPIFLERKEHAALSSPPPDTRGTPRASTLTYRRLPTAPEG